MQRRDIVVAGVVFAVGGFLLWRYLTPRTQPAVGPTPSPAPTSSAESQIEGVFDVEIPDDREKAELRPVGGSDGVAIASRFELNGRRILSVLADLPDTELGYEVYIPASGQVLGGLNQVKGGWAGEFDNTADPPVTELEVRSGEQVVLRGSF